MFPFWKHEVTPLCIASNDNDTETVEALLRFKHTKTDVISFHNAVRRNNLKMVEAFLNSGVDPNAIHENKTALDLAIQMEDVNIVKALLQHSKIHVGISSKVTSFYLPLNTRKDCKSQIDTFLREKGVDEMAIEITPLHRAILTENNEMVQLLLDYGAKSQEPSAGRISELELAVLRGNQNIIHILQTSKTAKTAKENMSIPFETKETVQDNAVSPFVV